MNPVVTVISVIIMLLVGLGWLVETNVSKKREVCEAKGGALVRFHGGTACFKSEMVVK
jgi:hypothetical protein